MAAVRPPPPPPASKAAASGDGDLQAVDDIPKDVLVTLLKRKGSEAKKLSAQLETLEERYVKVVRFNKILMEDRTSFLRFCESILPESGGVFEEAAAQETPVNLDALQRQLASWRGALEGASDDRKTIRQFLETVFPGDAEVNAMFDSETLGAGAGDVLQRRWAALEDLHNQSIASVNAMSREQMLSRGEELEEARASRKEADRKIQELTAQLTEFHREKAKVLASRLGGGPGAAAEASPRSEAGAGAGDGELLRLREALCAAERREQEARAAALRREEELRESMDSQQAEVQRLRRDLEHMSSEGERQKSVARKMVEEKDSASEQLRTRMEQLEQEVNSNAFINQLAEHQAGRDSEVRAMRRQVESVSQSMAEIQRLLALSYSQERLLKERIRELEGSHCRGHVTGDYLKHVMMKYMEYTQSGDLKAQGLVPVLATLLALSPEERRTVESSAVPQPLLLLNQAVGGASSWFRGSAADGGGGGSASPGGGLLPAAVASAPAAPAATTP